MCSNCTRKGVKCQAPSIASTASTLLSLEAKPLNCPQDTSRFPMQAFPALLQLLSAPSHRDAPYLLLPHILPSLNFLKACLRPARLDPLIFCYILVNWGALGRWNTLLPWQPAAVCTPIRGLSTTGPPSHEDHSSPQNPASLILLNTEPLEQMTA